MAARTTAAEPLGFSADVETIGERLVLRLPPEVSAELPSRGQVAATVTYAGAAAETVVEPDGRRGHWLPIEQLPGPTPPGSGSVIELSLQPHKRWPEPVVPPDLGSALAEAKDLDETWDSLTPMARWEWVRWIGATKNPDTRAKRVRVAISKLHDGKRRPCCFDLSSCTDPEVARSGKLMEAGRGA